MPDEPAQDQSVPSQDGRGDRMALMRLYDELDDAGKQKLLQLALRLRRGGEPERGVPGLPEPLDPSVKG